MSAEPTPPPIDDLPINQRTPLEEAALGIYMHVAKRIKEGYSEQAIKEELITQGIKPETADAMLAKLNQSRLNVTHRHGRRNRTIAFGVMTLGLLLVLLGNTPVLWVIGGAVIVGGIYWLARATLQRNLQSS
jgi:hypothetical protein